MKVSLMEASMSDFGSLTILYSQPVAALQILTKDGTWKWIKHIDNALVNLVHFHLINLLDQALSHR